MVPVEWVAGFVEGEGTFTKHANYNHTTRNGVPIYYRTFVPTFQVSQKEAQPLDLIASFFAEKGVRGKVVFRTNASGGAHEYRVIGAKNCLLVASSLYDHMHSERKKLQLRDWVTEIMCRQREGTKVPTEYATA